jgi:hypothetical protein
MINYFLLTHFLRGAHFFLGFVTVFLTGVFFLQAIILK